MIVAGLLPDKIRLLITPEQSVYRFEDPMITMFCQICLNINQLDKLKSSESD